jgi:hypothetical protein
MQTLAVVPDELWIMMLTIIAFWFGGRFIKRDLGKPWVSKQQLELAREIVARRTGEAEGSMSAVKETRALPPVPLYRSADEPLSRRRSLRCRLIGANSPPTWP